MSNHRHLFFPVALFLFTCPSFSQQTNLNIQDIRWDYFVLKDLPDPIRKNSSQFDLLINSKSGVVGKFRVLENEDSRSICRLQEPPKYPLTEDCFYILPEQFRKKESIKHPTQQAPMESIPSSNQKISADPEKIIPTPPISKPQPFTILGISFRPHNDIYLIPTPLPYQRFNSISDLSSYIKTLNESAAGKYSISLPSEEYIKKNINLFSPYVRNNYLLCMIGDRIGYFYIENQKPVFSTVSTLTLSKFSNKFRFILVAREV